MGKLLKYLKSHAGVLSLHVHAHSYARQARPNDYDILYRHCGRHQMSLEDVRDGDNRLQIAGGVAVKADGESSFITLRNANWRGRVAKIRAPIKIYHRGADFNILYAPPTSR